MLVDSQEGVLEQGWAGEGSGWAWGVARQVEALSLPHPSEPEAGLRLVK